MKNKNLRTGKKYRILSGMLSAAVLLAAVSVSAAAETTEDTETVVVQEENLSEKEEIEESAIFNEEIVSEDKGENLGDSSDVEEAAESEAEPQADEKEIGNSSESSGSDFIIEDGVLVSYNGAEQDVTIPAGVTVIGFNAFASNEDIESVVIPEGVIKIEDYAFQDCINLSSITVPDSVDSVSKSAFEGTEWFYNMQEENPLVVLNHILIDGLEASGNVTIPSEVTVIGASAFEYADITGVNMPDSVKRIEEWAFSDCTNLENIEFSENLNYIGNHAFSGCSSLQSLELPQKLYKIGLLAFDNCSNLKKVVIPSSVYHIDDREDAEAFYKCPVTIYGENNSYAQFYAEKYNIPFQSTGENASGITLLIENFKGIPSDTQMEFTWDEVIGADGYVISAMRYSSFETIARIEGGGVSSYTYNDHDPNWIRFYRIQAYRIIDGEEVLGSYVEISGNGNVKKEQKIRMTVAAQERDLKNGSRTTTSKACTLKLGFDVEDPDLQLVYWSDDAEVAEVKDGKITYQGVGSCIITVLAEETATCEEAMLEIEVKVGKPGKPSFTPSVTSKTAKKAFIVTSSTVKGVDGWEVQYSIRNDFWRATTKDFPNTGMKLYRKTCKTVHSNKTYYIRVRGYQMVDGEKVYSAWSSVKTVRTK